jgi:hypothetical protein
VGQPSDGRQRHWPALLFDLVHAGQEVHLVWRAVTFVEYTRDHLDAARPQGKLAWIGYAATARYGIGQLLRQRLGHGAGDDGGCAMKQSVELECVRLRQHVYGADVFIAVLVHMPSGAVRERRQCGCRRITSS